MKIPLHNSLLTITENNWSGHRGSTGALEVYLIPYGDFGYIVCSRGLEVTYNDVHQFLQIDDIKNRTFAQVYL